MSILDHLRELRKRLIVVLWTAGICIVGCFVFAMDIFNWLVAPMNRALLAHGEGTMAITDPTEGIITYLKVALLAGLVIASPVIFYQLWAFVAPGLYAREKKTVIPLVVASTSLFLIGASFGYFVIFQYGFEFFLSVIDPAETAAVLSINSYLVTATKLLAAFGLSFQLPVVVFFLARIGLIDARDMVRYFRYAIVAIFVLAAVITPPDPLTQTLMAGPLVVLYGISILIAWAVSTKERLPEGDDS
jgi:sec-independent protein translocase protein TatC